MRTLASCQILKITGLVNNEDVTSIMHKHETDYYKGIIIGEGKILTLREG